MSKIELNMQSEIIANLISEISDILLNSDIKISTAESCTAGKISSYLTSVSGSSKYFNGSLVVYSNDIKIDVLGVDRRLIDEYTEVSEQVAIDMATKIKKIMNTEYSIATTGYADISGYGTDKNPPGTIYVAVSTPYETIVKRINSKSSRNENLDTASIYAFNILLEKLKNLQVL